VGGRDTRGSLLRENSSSERMEPLTSWQIISEELQDPHDCSPRYLGNGSVRSINLSNRTTEQTRGRYLQPEGFHTLPHTTMQNTHINPAFRLPA
jgi:hypothetical protein